MSLAYNALVRARISDSKWKPSIYVDIVPPKSITDIVASCVDMKYVGKTNIVPLMAEPSQLFNVILSDELKYPKGASFCFDGFYGVNDKDQLVSHIIDSAKKEDGTQLVPGRYNNTPTQKKYVIYYNVLLHYNFINVTLIFLIF